MHARKLRNLLLALLLQSGVVSNAQITASTDPAFLPGDQGFGHGDGLSGDGVYTARALLEQPDHRLLAFGSFQSYNGLPADDGVRLLPDGEIDPSFSTGEGTNGDIYAAVLLADGKFIIGGAFTEVDGHPYQALARLNSDGSVDTTFHMLDFNDNNYGGPYVFEILITADDRILAGGIFLTVDGDTLRNLVRLLPSGDVDPTFQTGSGFYGYPAQQAVKALLPCADGRVLVGGEFATFNGDPVGRIVRLMPDGSRDISFGPGPGLEQLTGCSHGIIGVQTMAFTPEGRIVVGGGFSHADGEQRNKIAVLNADGSLFHGFDPGSGFYCEAPIDLSVRPDGGILIVLAANSTYDGRSVKHLLRVGPDGLLDDSFHPFLDPIEITVQSDGKLLLGASTFSGRAGLSRGIMRLEENGDPDTGFNRGSGSTGEIFGIGAQSTGKLIVGGYFYHFDGQWAEGCVRIDPLTGAVDPAFSPQFDFSGFINAIAVQPDDKVLLGGFMYDFADSSDCGIIRLLPDGSFDSAFVRDIGPTGGVRVMRTQSDGHILVGGSIGPEQAGTFGLARLDPNGALDTTFGLETGTLDPALLPDSMPPYHVRDIAVLPDDRFIITGGFSAVDGQPAYGIARFLPDGTLDPTFDAGSGFADLSLLPDSIPPYEAARIVLLPDGRMIVSGYFDRYNGSPCSGVIVLMEDGSIDAGTNSAIDGYISSMCYLPDGSVTLAGMFSEINGQGRPGLASIAASDGTLLPLSPSSGFSAGLPNVMVPTIDGGLIVAGSFTSYDGEGANRILKLAPVSTGLPESFDEFSSEISYVTLEDRITVTIDGKEPCRLRLLDMKGRPIRQLGPSVGPMDVPLSDLASGAYILQIASTGSLTYRRITKL